MKLPVLVIAAAMAAAPAALLADPPAHAPAHGYRAKHRYVYYPSQEIYYEPERGLWFWLDGGDWEFGLSLPTYYRQYTSGGISIELDTDKPYTEHHSVVSQYGGKSKKAGLYDSKHAGESPGKSGGKAKAQGNGKSKN